MAPRIGWWKRVSIRWAGRRDAATAGPNNDGHHSTTLALAAEVARVEAHIHTALVTSVETLDRSIARSETQIKLLSAKLSERREGNGDNVPGSMTAAEQDVVRVRQARARDASARFLAAQHELDEIKGQVAELSERREHLHSTAVGILESWVAWFDALAAHHQSGFLRALRRRFPAPVLTIKDPGNLPRPKYAPNHSWAVGEQLPVTITEINADEQPTLAWSHLRWNS